MASRWLAYLTRELDSFEEAELRVPALEVALFWRQLAMLLRNGVPLARATEVLRSQTASAALRLILDRSHERLLKGMSLSQVLRCFPGIFNNLAVGLVLSGEKTGSLVNVLERLADLEERSMRRRASTMSALIYPVLLLLSTLAVSAIFLLFVAPGDQSLFALGGGPPPWPSRVLMALGDPKIWIALGTAAVTGWLAAAALYHRFPLAWDARLLKIPVVGEWLRDTQVARVLDVLSGSLPVGFAVTEALKLAQHVCTNREFARHFANAVESVYNGLGMGESLARTGMFPRFVTATIEVAEESGQMDNTLARLCLSVDEQVQDSLDTVTSLIGPLFLGLAGVLAGFLALAIFLPIVSVTMSI
ncbi:MAG: type II secretion system F family protein [Candidatus Eremiobacteraeota bacterium]|nr:type II secretion system F family protein [Candidatus Eremiobacteraeota bacterium]MCW5869547.1 type II secretion system F family protein [Candidatus Eremiobacteraeota bacterium]